MNDDTKAEYRKLAKHFYQKQKLDELTSKTIRDALKACAEDYRPDYWRRLRSALALVAEENGFYKAAKEIRGTLNPITSNQKQRHRIKKKQDRQKSVSRQDEDKLYHYLLENNEETVYAAIKLVSYLGCRPAELLQVQFLDSTHINIPSAKKTSNHKRGLDRIIEINDSNIFKDLRKFHHQLKNASYTNPVRYVQRRLDVLTKRLWPKRKLHPSLYSWRHQLGADLKASGMPAAVVAAIMGHQSIESVNVYGNPRKARHSRSYMQPVTGNVTKVKQRNQPLQSNLSPLEEKIQELSERMGKSSRHSEKSSKKQFRHKVRSSDTDIKPNS